MRKLPRATSPQLATLAHLPERTVRRCLAELADVGALQIVSESGFPPAKHYATTVKGREMALAVDRVLQDWDELPGNAVNGERRRG